MVGGREGDDVKLLGYFASPFVLRTKVALNLKGVEYENLVEQFGCAKSELLLTTNPIYKKIPVLIHRGRPLCESMIIVQYVNDVWGATGPAIVPSDPYDAAVARFWAYYLDEKWFPIFRGLITDREEARIKAAKETIAALQPLEEAFQQCSNGKPFFGGDTIGYLDIALGGYLGWLEVSEKLTGIEFLDEKKLPLLAAWANRFRAHDAVKEAMPNIDRLLEFAWTLIRLSSNSNGASNHGN